MIKRLFKNNAAVILLSIIVILCFSVSLSYGFLDGWDDQYYIINNHRLALSLSNLVYWFTSPYFNMYIPLTMLTYCVDYSIWGLNSPGYHLQNVLWHVIAAVAVYKCFSLMGIRRWLAFAASLAFAVSPQRIETVVWISDRKDVLCGALYFLALFFHLKKGSNIYTFCLYSAAMLAKPMAASLPVILVLYEFNKTRCFNLTYYIRKFWFYSIPFLLVVPMAALSTTDNSSYDCLERVCIYSNNVFWYFWKNFLPYGTNPLYPRYAYYGTDFYVKYLIFFSLAALFMLYALKKNRINLIFNILPLVFCYLVSLFPVGGFFVLGGIDHADRYSYIPSAFLWFTFALSVNHLTGLIKGAVDKKITCFIRYAFVVVMCIYVLVNCFITVKGQAVWKSMYSFSDRASNCAEAEFPNPVGLNILSEAEIDRKNYDRADQIANILLKMSGHPYTHESTNLYCYDSAIFIKINIANQKNNFAEVIRLYSKLIPVEKFEPRYKKLFSTVGNCYYLQGRNEEAAKSIGLLLNLQELSDFEKMFYSGRKMFYLGNYDKAAFFFRKALEIHPDDENTLLNLKTCQNLQSGVTLK